MIKKSEVLLRRKNKIVATEPEVVIDSKKYVAVINKNIENLGYTFSEKLFNALAKHTKEELEEFYRGLIKVLEKQRGADVVYKPMYPNFPEQVMEMGDFELYMNAIIHYWSEGMILPHTEVDKRFPLFEEGKVEVIDLGTDEELAEIFVNLVKSKTSLSETDKEDVKWFYCNRRDVVFEYIPEEIPLKENVALISKLTFRYLPEERVTEVLKKYVKTATDVLRVAVALSDGDVSLAEKTRFKNFSRRERRVLMQVLGKCGKIEEDMLRYKNEWIRLGEKVHPREMKEPELENVRTAFDKLRNNKKIETFGGKIAELMEIEDYDSIVRLLMLRPGEFARKLDMMLRKTPDKKAVVNAYKDVANKVATPVLLQVRQHFINRNVNKDYRVFFPKGQLARSYNRKNDLPMIDEKWCKAIVSVSENALVYNYMKKDFMGSVYLSEEFKNYIVPFSQRSASKTVKAATRGSRIKIDPEAKAVRSFIWWTNNTDDDYDRIDIDLSAAIFSDEWKCLEHVSYTNLKSSAFNVCHSGDIVNGGSVNGDGVAEFIDVDIDSVVKAGGRYVVFQVYDFSELPYDEVTNARFGWMERESVNDGEIFEPKTVQQKMDLTAKSSISVPVIFDCVKREYIWCDMSVSIESTQYHKGGNNIESNLGTVEAVCYSVVELDKPNLYDLIDLHIRARGVRTETKENADIIFDIDDGITPYDIDVFMGEYL